MRKHISFANVVSAIALFVVLGGTSIAAVNVITSKDIKNKTIKNKDVKGNTLKGNKINESTLEGVDKCPPAAPNRIADICYSGAQPASAWDPAVQGTCPSQGLRLPTIGEALLVMNAVGGGPGNETWTDEVTDISPSSTRGLVKAPGDPTGQVFTAPAGSSHSSRCVVGANN